MTDAFALLGISLVLCTALLTLLTAWSPANRQAVWAQWLTLLCFVMLWIPIGAADISVVAYIRGITADLSVTLIGLSAWQLGRRAMGWRTAPHREHMSVLAAVAGAALLLYPLALGWGDWDAYRPGWGSWGMLLALLVLCGGCFAKGLRLLPSLVALALLAWSFGLMESGNLWDYLIDPWLSIFALAFVFIKCINFLVVRFR